MRKMKETVADPSRRWGFPALLAAGAAVILLTAGTAAQQQQDDSPPESHSHEHQSHGHPGHDGHDADASHDGDDAHAGHGSHDANVDRSMVRGHTFEETARWVSQFEKPGRAEYQMPEEVVAALDLQAGDAVADIGAGSGYFTFHLARAVGKTGRVYAVDIEPGMIEHIEQRREEEEGGAWVETVLAVPDNPKLAVASVDLAIIVNTYHHISERVAYLGTLEQALRPGARVVIVDYREGDLPVGPPPAHKLSRAEVTGEFIEAGFHLDAEESFLPYQYILVFRPGAS